MNESLMDLYQQERQKNTTLRTMLMVLLDLIDYTPDGGACRPNEAVGAILPVSILTRAKKVLKENEEVMSE